MRKTFNLSQAIFTKENNEAFISKNISGNFEKVSLPHTWNNKDGQDGGSDYYRGACWYQIAIPAHTAGKRQFVEFEAANHVAKVYCNGTYMGEHRGGFSTFRFELTNLLKPTDNFLSVCVENGDSNHVYPQQADFSFCGGLYRPVHFIEVENSHFNLTKSGTNGVFVTPTIKGSIAEIRVDAFLTNTNQGASVKCCILDDKGVCVKEETVSASEHVTMHVNLENPHLWQGLNDPYCYTAKMVLIENGVEIDETLSVFGVRSFEVDANKGFILNEKPYHLHGVSRHQDRFDKGWALSKEDQEQDLALIGEVGANTIRLAHYQHSQYFYNLCDEKGMVLWAEIPFISVFDEHPDAVANTHSQMKELIAQNYNHPSICFWGISNEITIAGEAPGLLDNLKQLSELTQKMDPSRLSTMAQVSMVAMDSPHNFLTDILAYNHYFGWYGGKVEDNGPWMDAFHAKNPTRPLGISEYGAEGILKWHTATPKVKDYTEEYQAYYHEKMLEAFATRPYIWGTYVWNMFDFAADSRDEGGCQGRNNKGLVTYDRTIKKDSFYAYKAWWSTDEFVHIAGRRFVDRDGETTAIKVYSNCKEITLTVNGKEIGTQKGEHVFVFENVVLQKGSNTIKANSNCGKTDEITLNGVDAPNQDYILPQEDNSEEVRNWFSSIATEETELRFPDGYYSIKDTFGELMKNEETEKVLTTMIEAAMGKSMAKMANGMMGNMMKGQTMEMLFSFAGDKLPSNARVMLNEQLIKIKK